MIDKEGNQFMYTGFSDNFRKIFDFTPGTCVIHKDNFNSILKYKNKKGLDYYVPREVFYKKLGLYLYLDDKEYDQLKFYTQGEVGEKTKDRILVHLSTLEIIEDFNIKDYKLVFEGI